jgi:DNA-binding Lrp family transcriptional regulator
LRGKTKKMLKSKDRALLKELQDNFPLESHPYLAIAKRLRLTEEEAIKKTKTLKKKKIIRYVGAIFDTKKLGLSSTLVAMSVPRKRIKRVSKIINSYPEVSHNYLRNDKFNLWFTLSTPSRAGLLRLLGRIKSRTGISQALNLATLKVFKIDARFGLLKK